MLAAVLLFQHSVYPPHVTLPSIIIFFIHNLFIMVCPKYDTSCFLTLLPLSILAWFPLIFNGWCLDVQGVQSSLPQDYNSRCLSPCSYSKSIDCIQGLYRRCKGNVKLGVLRIILVTCGIKLSPYQCLQFSWSGDSKLCNILVDMWKMKKIFI